MSDQSARWQLYAVLASVTARRATSCAIRNEGTNPRFAPVIRAVERERVAICRDVVVASLFDQLTAGIPAPTTRPDFPIDNFGVQLAVAFNVRHHPHDIPRVSVGNVGSEARAPEVDLPCRVEMTDFVEERGAIQDPAYVRVARRPTVLPSGMTSIAMSHSPRRKSRALAFWPIITA